METVVLESVARQWLHRQWLEAQRERQGPTPSRFGRPAQTREQDWDECPVIHLLPDLLRLIEDSHDRSVEELRSPIQRMICESVFTDSNGDTMESQVDPGQVELLVQVVVRTLSELREDAKRRGAWSSEPATIPMCG